MRQAVLLSFLLFGLAPVAGPAKPLRVWGWVESLKFVRLAEPGDGAGTQAAALRRLMPKVLPPSDRLPPGLEAGRFELRDFPLPRRPQGGALVLRQVIDRSNPARSRDFWALYESRRRTGVWRFDSTDDEYGGAPTAGPEILSVETQRDGTLWLHTCGRTDELFGKWRREGWDYSFRLTRESLDLSMSSARYAVEKEALVDDGTIKVSSRWMRPSGKLDFRSADFDAQHVGEAGLCAFRDPECGGPDLSSADWERFARCVIESSGRPYRCVDPDEYRRVAPGYGTQDKVDGEGTVTFEGSLKEGKVYRADVHCDDDSGLWPVVPIQIAMHQGAGLRWTNLEEFPELEPFRMASPKRIVFQVEKHDREFFQSQYRWANDYVCKVLRVEDAPKPP
jgi:hypothetical protein